MTHSNRPDDAENSKVSSNDSDGSPRSLTQTSQPVKPLQRRKPPFIKRLTKTIDKYGPILTIAAMLIAILELYVVHQSANEIENLSRAAATRYISRFPSNMPELTKMIKATETSLTIACDFAAYGHFSAPQEFADYSSALQALAKSGKTVKLICYNAERAIEARKDQFSTDWEKIQSRQSFRSFFGKHPDPPKSLEEFFAFLEKRELKFKCDINAIGIDVQETSKTLPAFFWISDETRSIFSFYAYGNEGNESREVSMQTIDSSILRTFVEVTTQIKSEKFNYFGNCSGNR